MATQLAGKLLAGALGNSALPSQHGAGYRWRDAWVGGGKGCPVAIKLAFGDSGSEKGQSRASRVEKKPTMPSARAEQNLVLCLQFQDGLAQPSPKGAN